MPRNRDWHQHEMIMAEEKKILAVYLRQDVWMRMELRCSLILATSINALTLRTKDCILTIEYNTLARNFWHRYFWTFFWMNFAANMIFSRLFFSSNSCARRQRNTFVFPTWITLSSWSSIKPLSTEWRSDLTYKWNDMRIEVKKCFMMLTSPVFIRNSYQYCSCLPFLPRCGIFQQSADAKISVDTLVG